MVDLIMGRRTDIDRAKGLAILLVVFGHIVARADPSRVNWYEPLRRAVYAFHMPFFFYLSGLAAALSGAAFIRPAAWPLLARNRIIRLLLPFFCLGLLIVTGKTAAASIIFVDNAPDGLLHGLGTLIWSTAKSPAISVWYLFVLFVLSLLVPLAIWADQGRLRILITVALLLYVIPFPAYVYADHIGRYAIFFAAGIYAGSIGEDWSKFVDRYWHWLGVIFFCSLAAIICFGADWKPIYELLPLGLLSMPVLHGLVRNSAAQSKLLLWLGRYSFMIYLFNTLFIGLAKGLLLRITDWNGPHFAFFAFILMASGTLGPIALKQLAFSRIRRLDRLTS